MDSDTDLLLTYVDDTQLVRRHGRREAVVLVALQSQPVGDDRRVPEDLGPVSVDADQPEVLTLPLDGDGHVEVALEVRLQHLDPPTPLPVLALADVPGDRAPVLRQAQHQPVGTSAGHLERRRLAHGEQAGHGQCHQLPCGIHWPSRSTPTRRWVPLSVTSHISAPSRITVGPSVTYSGMMSSPDFVKPLPVNGSLQSSKRVGEPVMSLLRGTSKLG